MAMIYFINAHWLKLDINYMKLENSKNVNKTFSIAQNQASIHLFL